MDGTHDMSNPTYERTSGGGGATTQTPTYDSTEVHTYGSFGRSVPVSEDFLAWVIAIFTVGGTIAIIEQQNQRAAWILTGLMLLGMVVINEERIGLIAGFTRFIEGGSTT